MLARSQHFPQLDTVLIAALLLLSIATVVRAQDPSAGSTRAQPPIARSLPDFTPLVKQQGPAVVNVITAAPKRQQLAQQGPTPEDPFAEFFRRFMPDMPPPGTPPSGMGSGFIISEDGYILTNAHVVANAQNVTVRLADAKREFQAKVVGRDERTDVALIKVDAKNLPIIKPGDSTQLEPGDWVAAIGSPFGFSNTITAGIVSAKERSLPSESFVPFIQTDVAVNPGNSGGPLLNLNGEVIGINSMIYSRTGGYMGVSFAIPIEVALNVSEQLRKHGKVTRGRLGVQIQPLTRELAQSFGLKEPSGALISSVEPDAPAAKAGLQAGDVILQYNGKPINEANDLPRLVANTKPGEQAQIEVWREKAPRHFTVTIGAFPEGERVAQGGAPGAGTPSQLGITVTEIPPAERQALGIDYGLRVVSVEKAGEKTQLKPGDVIVGVSGKRFKSIEEFNRLVKEQERDNMVALLVRRGEGAIYVPAQVG